MVQFPPWSSLSLQDHLLSSHISTNHKNIFCENKTLASHSWSCHILTSCLICHVLHDLAHGLPCSLNAASLSKQKICVNSLDFQFLISILTTTFKSQFQVFCTVSTFSPFPWLTSFKTTCSNNSVFPVVLIVYCLYYFFSSADNSLPVSPVSSRVKSKDHDSGLSFPHSFRSLSPLFLYISCLSIPQLYLNQIYSSFSACTWSVEHGQKIYTHTLEL